MRLKKLKLSNDPKNYQNFTWNNLCCVLPIENVLKSNPNSTVTLTPNLNESFSMLRFLFGDVSICKHRTWQNSRNLRSFLSHPPRMISWELDKSHDFQTSFAFYRILKQFGHTFVVMFREQDVRNFWSVPGYSLTLDLITWISFFHYSNHLRFKFDLSKKNLLNKIN